MRLRWREQQRDAYHYTLPSRLPIDDDFSDASTRAADYAEVGVFADDLGEYHWLLAQRRHARNGVPVMEADARRAVMFVYRWLLRWQQFDSNYPAARWRASYREMAPPTTAEPGPPQIVSCTFTEDLPLGGRDLRRVDIVVANVPERGRGTWGIDAPAALSAVASRRGLTTSDNAAFGDVLPSGDDRAAGRYSFLFARSVGGAEALSVLVDTVDECSRREADRKRATEEQARREREVLARLSPSFADDPMGLFGTVTLDTKVEPSGDVELLRIPLQGTTEELMHVGEIVRGVGQTLAAVGLDEGSLVIPVSTAADQQEHDLGRAVSACNSKVADLRARAAAMAAESQAFSEELRAAVRALPGSTSSA